MSVGGSYPLGWVAYHFRLSPLVQLAPSMLLPFLIGQAIWSKVTYSFPSLLNFYHPGVFKILASSYWSTSIHISSLLSCHFHSFPRPSSGRGVGMTPWTEFVSWDNFITFCSEFSGMYPRVHGSARRMNKISYFLNTLLIIQGLKWTGDFIYYFKTIIFIQ